MTTAMPTIAFGSNTSQYAWLTRARLMRVLVRRGCHVVLLAPTDRFSERFAGIGVKHIPVAMKMNTNPLSDADLFVKFLSILRKERPNAYLGFTVKPNIYGSIAANLLGIPVINNIAGLGTAFDSKGLLSTVVERLYRAALARSQMVFFQNHDDRDHLSERGVVRHDNVDVLPGSGVDLQRFRFQPRRADTKTVFLLVARMIRAKGIEEFAEAARMIRHRSPNTEFRLLGSTGNDNPGDIPKRQIAGWEREGLVRYLGFRENVAEEIRQSDCVVLPSYYREGTPRALLEAGAIGRPIITTDAAGCRDVVIDGVNGFCCAQRDAGTLAEKMQKVISLTPDQRIAMGRAGRSRVERLYDEDIVISKYLSAITRLGVAEDQDRWHFASAGAHKRLSALKN